MEESEFLAADKLVQTEFAYQQPGLLRRTTARGNHGSWTVVDLWNSQADADRGNERWGQDTATEAYTHLVDPTSVTSERYETLD